MLENYFIQYGPIKSAALRNGNKLYTGVTHAVCFTQEPKGVLRNAEQGFVTENGQFVNRVDGLKIAKYYNQVKTKHPPLDLLMSEDLI